MNIFISWSGDRSHQVALLFKEWIQGVVQAAKPWISSEDIGSGTRWFAKISEQIDTSSQGVICITHENKDKSWILYEAGALSKGQGSATYVIPLLVDLENQDIIGPLAQFNAVIAGKKDSMKKLVLDLNRQLPPDSRIEEAIVKRVFDAFWPEFDNGLKKIITNTQASAPAKQVRQEHSIMLEILGTVRSLDKRVHLLESRPSIISAEPPLANVLSVSQAEAALQEATKVLTAVKLREREALNSQFALIQSGIANGLNDDAILRSILDKYPAQSENYLLNVIYGQRINFESNSQGASK